MIYALSLWKESMLRFVLLIICSVIVGCSSQSTQQQTSNSNDLISPNTALYLRGDMTNWEARTEYQFQQRASHLYTVKADLPDAGKTYHFKFADAQWLPAFNYGAAIDDAVLTLNSPAPIRAYSCLDELTFVPEQAGKYEFVLDLRGRKPIAFVQLAQ
ncbi:hypothetical protein [uncultured Tolumonas sp.]|uniref:hypothetical protein n=1 Tax=uncultured Tolumonas sp. TaxID=263765 RepID=UPI0029303987|nr:hypothetical protein [uncultured Tolumonas sp.]